MFVLSVGEAEVTASPRYMELNGSTTYGLCFPTILNKWLILDQNSVPLQFLGKSLTAESYLNPRSRPEDLFTSAGSGIKKASLMLAN